MKKPINKLPEQKTQSLYHFTNVGASCETSQTSGDPTNTTITILTTTHIWQK